MKNFEKSVFMCIHEVKVNHHLLLHMQNWEHQKINVKALTPRSVQFGMAYVWLFFSPEY